MHSKHDDGKSGDDNQCDLVMNDDGVALGESSFFNMNILFNNILDPKKMNSFLNEYSRSFKK